jgi:hypothetical protein
MFLAVFPAKLPSNRSPAKLSEPGWMRLYQRDAPRYTKHKVTSPQWS